MLSARNKQPLTEEQIERCVEAWTFLCGDKPRDLDVSRASNAESNTVYNQDRKTVFLGADVLPGEAISARSQMSVLACLAHELAHLERHEKQFDRSTDIPEKYLDEAETSIYASFSSFLSPKDKRDLIEDAHDCTGEWLMHR